MYNKVVKFIRELYDELDAIIPLHSPIFIGNEKEYLNECIDTTFVSSVGKFVDRFEEMIAEYTSAKKAVVCVNGTSALHISLLLSGAKSDDEVITQSLTFIATANAISYCGATLVFIDIDRDTLGLSPEILEYWLKNNTKYERSKKKLLNKLTKRSIAACVPVHTFGHPCRIEEIIDVCNKFNIPVVEDAAESIGSKYKEKYTGTFGKIGVLSFNGNKTITTGGGMILTNNEELDNLAKHITTTAKIPHKWEYVHDRIGFNYRMPNINAALGCAQIEQLNNFIKNKREIAVKYKEFFNNISDIEFFTEPEDAFSNYWLNAFILKNKAERDNFLQYTNENRVMTRPIWRLMNRLEMFKDCQCGDLSNAEWLVDRVVDIPSSVIR